MQKIKSNLEAINNKTKKHFFHWSKIGWTKEGFMLCTIRKCVIVVRDQVQSDEVDEGLPWQSEVMFIIQLQLNIFFFFFWFKFWAPVNPFELKKYNAMSPFCALITILVASFKANTHMINFKEEKYDLVLILLMHWKKNWKKMP